MSIHNNQELINNSTYIYRDFCTSSSDYNADGSGFSDEVMIKKVHEVLKPNQEGLFFDYSQSLWAAKYGSSLLALTRSLSKKTYLWPDKKRALIYPWVKLIHDPSMKKARKEIQSDLSDISYEMADATQRSSMIFSYLTNNLHFSPMVASGILWNMRVESYDYKKWIRLSTKVFGDGESSLWLCQRKGVRKRALETYVKNHGKNVFDYTTQLDFMYHELTEGSEKKAMTALLQAKTVSEATEIFLKKYERAGIHHFEHRNDYAMNVYQDYAHMV